MALDITGFFERHWLELLLFVLALFNDKIRRFLSVMTARTGNAFQWYIYNTAKNKLEQIQKLHGNAYELLLYLTMEAMVFLGGGILFGLWWVYFKSSVWMGAIIIAMLVNKFTMLFGLVFRLLSYEHSVQSLKRDTAENAPKPKVVTA